MRGGLALGALAVALATAAMSAVATIQWDEADHHVGEEVTVEGRVLGVHCSPLSCLLAFEPTFNRFTAVIQAASFDKFPPKEVEERYTGRRVQVAGRIETRDGKPEIVVDKPDALNLVEEKEPPAAAAGRAAQAQTELLDRLADVLSRVEDLTERLAATQERIDGLLAQMEQREAALAAALASQAPPPPPPGPMRPASQALRQVKRGMAAGDVERLLGAPQYVENFGQGWSTWDYGGGRSVTFDERGRVQSLTGFAP